MAPKSHYQVDNSLHLPPPSPNVSSKSHFLKWGFLLVAVAFLVIAVLARLMPRTPHGPRPPSACTKRRRLFPMSSTWPTARRRGSA